MNLHDTEWTLAGELTNRKRIWGAGPRRSVDRPRRRATRRPETRYARGSGLWSADAWRS